MKKIIVLFAAATLVLSGCSVFTPKKETVCVYDDDEYMEFKITSVSKGDKILTDEFYSSFEMEDYIKEGFSIEELEKDLEGESEEYDVEGVTYTYKVTEEKASYTVLIDYKKVDFDEAMELGLVDEDSEKDANYVDFETTIEGREEDGMTCKTK